MSTQRLICLGPINNAAPEPTIYCNNVCLLVLTGEGNLKEIKIRIVVMMDEIKMEMCFIG